MQRRRAPNLLLLPPKAVLAGYIISSILSCGNNAKTCSEQSSADPVPAFRNFVSTEKDRLIKKKQALIKNEMDKRMADLVKFSKSFKVRGRPLPRSIN